MLHCKRRLMWNISENMNYTPFFFRRNRDLGTVSVYLGCRGVRCLPPCPKISNPHPKGVIISQPKTSFLGVGLDGDHDFEGPRSPKAHLDTVNAIGNLSLDGGSTRRVYMSYYRTF